MEHVKLLEVESQHLSFCCYMQQVQLEGDQTVKCKAKVKVTEPFTKMQNYSQVARTQGLRSL